MNCALIYFSPTATTRTVLEQIAKGMGAEVTTVIDLTLPAVRQAAPDDISEKLVLVGAPVYGGRLPAEAAAFFNKLKGAGAAAVPVVVLGNRAYEDALLELKNILADRGFVPLAAGAFIGEHSFSNSDMPIAPGRPDNKDLQTASRFGKEAADLLNGSGKEDLQPVEVPGNFPYKEIKLPPPHPFIDVADGCTFCGTCAAVCPAGAVDEAAGFETIDEKCLHCCACIKCCPEGVRTMKDGMLKEKAAAMSQSCAERKEPEYFLAG